MIYQHLFHKLNIFCSMFSIPFLLKRPEFIALNIF